MQRKPTVEELIITACVIVFLLIIAWFLSGCMRQAQRAVTVRYVNGCMIEMSGMQSATFTNVEKEFDLYDCALDSTNTRAGRVPQMEETP